MKTKELTADSVWREYEKMLAYNDSIQLDDTVRVNENFFIGKQWEGVESNGLPTPQFNFLKRVTLFTVASITSDKLKLQCSPLPSGAGDRGLRRAADVINAEFEALFEHNKLTWLLKEYMRNAAVDGDGATYTWWDADADSGDGRHGAIVTEIVQNTRIGFGNTADRHVQSQPYILIKRREMTDALRERARRFGCAEWQSIKEDTDEQLMDAYKDTGEKTTVILRLWKDDKTGTVWGCECARGVMIRKPWDLGLRLYPVTWLCWDYVQDSYHGQALITGLIPNQIYINKLFAMSMISLMATAYPKIVYDKTRIPRWDNGIGRAIGVNGGGVDNVARVLGPAQISPQIAQFIELTQSLTQTNLGATSVALGEAKPDNTSAIIALQRAAATPNEITRQNLYQSIEDLGAIYMDFMSGYYGLRPRRDRPRGGGLLRAAGLRGRRAAEGRERQDLRALRLLQPARPAAQAQARRRRRRLLERDRLDADHGQPARAGPHRRARISRARARRLHHRPPGPHKRHHRPPRRRGHAVGPDRLRGESIWKRTPFRPPPKAGSGR